MTGHWRALLSGFVAGSFALVLLAGCHKTDPLSKIKKTKMDMKEFEEDLVVPSSLWKAMETSYLPLVMDAEGKAIKEGAEEGGEKEAEKEGAKPAKAQKEDQGMKDLLKKKPPLDPISFTVYLIEKTPGVLGGQNYELHYSAGGGLLDYRAFVPGSKDGTFYLLVRYDQEMDPKDSRVYYLSDARVRQIDDKPLGNGCARYFDISSYWKRAMSGDGLMLNTTNLRHISVTAGTIFFVAPYRGKLRIAHLSIKDSRHRDLLCSSEKPEAK